MTDRTFRNHPCVILDGLIAYVIVAISVAFSLYGNGNVLGAAFAGAFIVCIPMAITVVLWMRTTVTFTDSEIIVRKDTAIVKQDTTIQYYRLASIGVRRNIWDMLFGTTTLLFNVNTSINATTPEARLKLKSDLADSVRDELNSLVFSKVTTIVEEREVESLVSISNSEIVIHSFLSQTTAQLVFAMIMLVYGIVSVISQNSSGLMLALLMIAIDEVIPMVRVIMRYFNYRLYRIDDTITIESGMITTARSSFKINRVNSVRMRQPLLARLIGLSTLEAEVVGLAGSGDADSICPLLCPLKRKSEVDALMRSLFPDIVVDCEPIHQGKGAMRAMLLRDAVYSIASVVVLILTILVLERYTMDPEGPLGPIVRVLEVVLLVMAPVLLFGHCGLAQRNRSFALGKESFMLVYGAYDTSEEYILYDRVQYATVSSSPIDRMFGVADCTVCMMSSSGFRSVRSGLFPPEDLKAISEEVMARIQDGRYDYLRYR